MFKKYMFLILFILLSLSAMADKTQITSSDFGLTIEYPKIDVFKIRTNVTLNFHVYNINGTAQTNDTTFCNIHIYNSDGTHILESNLTYDNDDFHIVLNKSLFYDEGYYTYITYCENDISGGFVSERITLTKDGYPPIEPNLLSLVIAQGIFIAFYLFMGVVNFIDGKKDMDKFSFWFGFFAFAMAIAQMILLLSYVHGAFTYTNTIVFQNLNLYVNILMMFALSMITYMRLAFIKSNFASDRDRWE